MARKRQRLLSVFALPRDRWPAAALLAALIVGLLVVLGWPKKGDAHEASGAVGETPSVHALRAGNPLFSKDCA
jgi:hypothetical protein